MNNNQNAIYLECFMDELAHAAGQDPLEFRRKLMANHPKHLAVLNAVAERVGWGKPAPQGVHRGLAQQMGYGSYVAAAAEISVTAATRSRSTASWPPPIAGHAVNPAQIERQVAGSFVYGLSALFYGECTVKDGRIEQTNFHDYNSMRIAEMPKVEVDHHAVRRFLGRRRRADHLRGGAGRAQRVLRGDRQAHPLGAAEEPQHRVRVNARSGGRKAAALNSCFGARSAEGRSVRCKLGLLLPTRTRVYPSSACLRVVEVGFIRLRWGRVGGKRAEVRFGNAAAAISRPPPQPLPTRGRGVAAGPLELIPPHRVHPEKTIRRGEGR